MDTRVAVITGASRGIGAVTADHLAARGYDLVLIARSARSSPGKLAGTLEDVAERVETAGRKALVLPLDIRDEAAVAEAVAKMYATFGRCDILINNAGAIVADPLLKTPTKRWQLVFDVNVTGAFFLIREVVPRMIEAGEGRVINISSGATVVPEYPFISYCASKRALEAMSEGLGTQTTPTVAVNALRIDAVVRSEGVAEVQGEDVAAEAESPHKVAEAIVWLAEQPLGLSGKTVCYTDILPELAPPAVGVDDPPS